MNIWVGGAEAILEPAPGVQVPILQPDPDDPWRIYTQLSDLVDPGPARTWVFLDVREDSIDIGNFATSMMGFPDQPSQHAFLDLPASYHNRAGGFSFADGHSEMRRWRDDRTMPALVKGDLVLDQIDSPHNPDVAWLQERCTRKVR